MEGIIFNTEAEFDTLQALLHAHVIANTPNYNADCWCKVINGTDGTFLMVGTDDARLSTFDYTGYTLEEIATTNAVYFEQLPA